MTEEQKKEISAVFHCLWGKGKDGPEYDKAEWTKLNAFLDSVLWPPEQRKMINPFF